MLYEAEALIITRFTVRFPLFPATQSEAVNLGATAGGKARFGHNDFGHGRCFHSDCRSAAGSTNASVVETPNSGKYDEAVLRK